MALLWHRPSADVTGCAEQRTACNAGLYGLFMTIRCEPGGFNARLLLDNTCLSTDEPADSPAEPLQGEDLKSVPLGAGIPSRPPLSIYHTAIAPAGAQVFSLHALQGGCSHSPSGNSCWMPVHDPGCCILMTGLVLASRPDLACHHLCSGESNARQGRRAGHGAEHLP